MWICFTYTYCHLYFYHLKKKLVNRDFFRVCCKWTRFLIFNERCTPQDLKVELWQSISLSSWSLSKVIFNLKSDQINFTTQEISWGHIATILEVDAPTNNFLLLFTYLSVQFQKLKYLLNLCLVFLSAQNTWHVASTWEWQEVHFKQQLYSHEGGPHN